MYRPWGRSKQQLPSNLSYCENLMQLVFMVFHGPGRHLKDLKGLFWFVLFPCCEFKSWVWGFDAIHMSLLLYSCVLNISATIGA